MARRTIKQRRPVELFLDSSFLRSLNPHSAFLESLREHAASGKVEIHVPWIVQQEVITGIAEEALTKDLKPLDRAVQWASNSSGFPIPHDQWTTIRKSLEDHVSKGVKAWLSSFQAIIDPPSNGDSTRVFERYFGGKPPFSKRKSRPDIPDGYIFDIIHQFTRTAVGPVHFIVRDGPLREHCKTIDNLLTHDTVESFLQQVPLQIEEDKKFPSQLQELLESPNHIDDVLSLISGGLLDELTFSTIKGNIFPNARHWATFAWPGPITNLRMDFSKTLRLSRDIAVLPLSCRMRNVGVYVQVTPDEHQRIQDDARFTYSSEDTNEANGIVLTTGVLLEIHATLGIHFGKEPDDNSEIPGITVEQLNRVRVLDFSLPATFGNQPADQDPDKR